MIALLGAALLVAGPAGAGPRQATPRCFGMEATIVGTEGDDVIKYHAGFSREATDWLGSAA